MVAPCRLAGVGGQTVRNRDFDDFVADVRPRLVRAFVAVSIGKLRESRAEAIYQADLLEAMVNSVVEGLAIVAEDGDLLLLNPVWRNACLTTQDAEMVLSVVVR